MSRRGATLLGTSLALTFALSVPAAGLASSGGGGLAPSGSAAAPSHPGQSAPSSPTTKPQPANRTVSASGDGMSIATRASAFLSNQLRFTGSAPAGDGGAVVLIQRLGHQTGWKWVTTVRATVAPGGSFSAIWRVNHIGRFAIRAVIAGASGGRASAASPTLTVTVFRSSLATLYGPGFWGSRTACGQVLRPNTLGVAHRTLRCGTPVAIYYRGRTITVPVIDRGPYANGADWDLTEATARTLGIGGTATIGAVSLPSRG